MARVTLAKTSSAGRPSTGRGAAVKTSASRQRSAAKPPAVVTGSASKEELRARVEKLERANATLRVKNKELRIVAVEAAEQVDVLTMQLASSERRAGRNARHESPAEAVETREIIRRGKRKAREFAAEGNGHDVDESGADAQTNWGSADHADA